MFDDLRPGGSAFDDDEDKEQEQEIEEAPAPAAKTVRRRRRSAGESEIRILGMTAAQRLVIAIMLFLNVSVLGCFLLIATGALYF
jgi:hypothetical protein